MLIEKYVVLLLNGLKVYVEWNVFDLVFDMVMFVNGVFVMIVLFGQIVQYFGEWMNMICFDLLYVGQLCQYNFGCFILIKDDEVVIFQYLVEYFVLLFFVLVLWGGVVLLFVFVCGCLSVWCVVICLFLLFLNDVMVDYVMCVCDYIVVGENLKVVQLLNDIVGCYLLCIMKLYNYWYLMCLLCDEQDQVVFYVDQILLLQFECYFSEFVNIGCELLFLNGECDEYMMLVDVW